MCFAATKNETEIQERCVCPLVLERFASKQKSQRHEPEKRAAKQRLLPLSPPGSFHVGIEVMSILTTRVALEMLLNTLPNRFRVAVTIPDGETTTERALENVVSSLKLLASYTIPHCDLEKGNSFRLAYQSEATYPKTYATLDPFFYMDTSACWKSLGGSETKSGTACVSKGL
jgi:hypothetical protein